jgi:antitoxin component YwqK of YwqJK toxin-antitoxin module
LSEKGFTFVVLIKNKQKMEQKKELNLINLYNEKGEKHGYWERYYGDGQLYYKGNYVDGKQHGYWEDYYSNGNLAFKGNYVDGKEHGYWESYWYNGKIRYKGTYVDGNRHGYWEVYHETGNLKYKGFYDQGKEVDYNPDEPKAIELTLDEIATKFGISVNQLKIKK